VGLVGLPQKYLLSVIVIYIYVIAPM